MAGGLMPFGSFVALLRSEEGVYWRIGAELNYSLIAAVLNPDKFSHGALAAELTNHPIAGVVLTPGMVGTLPELQRAGFDYAT